MRILYFGEALGTSAHRAAALRRLGHHVDHVDPRSYLPRNQWIDRWLWHTGAIGCDHYLAKKITATCLTGYDVAWINQGEFLGPACLGAIRSKANILANYCNDDPFGKRDGRRFNQYRQAIRLYDHVFVARESNRQEALDLGACAASRFIFTADEIAHQPLPCDDDRLIPWRGYIVFVGTWLPERSVFLEKLLSAGINIKIRGAHWEKSPEWGMISKCTDPRPLTGEDYNACIQGADAAICLLSQGNRDLHTSRSAEIPAVTGVLLAERTSEHESLFINGVEALFFDDVASCASAARKLQSNRAWRDSLAKAGKYRTISDQRYNEPELTRLLAILEKPSLSHT